MAFFKRLFADMRRAGAIESGTALPLLVSVGFGLLWGSLALRSVGNFSAPLTYIDIIGREGIVASNVIEVLLCLILALIIKRIDREKLLKAIVIVSLASTALLTLTIALSGVQSIQGSSLGLLSAVLVFLLGCSSVLPLVLWGSCFAVLDRETSTWCMLGSSLFGVIIYLAFACIPNDDLRWLLEKLCSLGSLIVYLVAIPLIPISEKNAGTRSTDGKTIAFFAEQAVICCGLGCSIVLSGMFRSNGINLVLSVIAVVALLGVACVLHTHIMQRRETLSVLIPMASCLVIAIPFVGAELPRVALAIPAIVYISWLTLAFIRFSECRAVLSIEPMVLVALTLFFARLSSLSARIITGYVVKEGAPAGLDAAIAFDILLAIAFATVVYATFKLLNLSNQSLKERVAREFVETEGSGRELAVKKVAEFYNLTDRECEVFALMAQGHTRKFIAERLVISEGTVRTHIANIYKKTGCSNKEEVIALANGLAKV